MGTKHDVLTRGELDAFRLTPVFLQAIENFVASREPGIAPQRINILDWGCGRGRAVAKLREAGFNAFGVDTDEMVMRNGYDLLDHLGFDPHELLLGPDALARYPDAYFHCIISEQVLEHVMDITATFAEMWRLSVPGGIGLHCFPGAGMLMEEHVNMPLIHWLPKNLARKPAIALCMASGFGPRQQWPETEGQGFWATNDIYYRYLDKKTYYRDIMQITAIAEDAGFQASYQQLGTRQSWQGFWLPAFIRRNGFPGATMFLRLSKSADSPAN